MAFKLLIVFGIVACVIGGSIALIPAIIQAIVEVYVFFQNASLYEAAGGIAVVGMVTAFIGICGYIFYDIWKLETGRS